jgi:hypothetical protein
MWVGVGLLFAFTSPLLVYIHIGTSGFHSAAEQSKRYFCGWGFSYSVTAGALGFPVFNVR